MSLTPRLDAAPDGPEPPEAPRPDVAAQVAHERVRILYQRTPDALLGGALFAVLLGWALAQAGTPLLAWGWCASKLLTQGLRWLDWRAHERDADAPGQPERWHRRHALGSVLDGLGWGLLGPLFLPTAQPALDGVLVAGLVGVASVGVFTLTSRFDDALRFMAATLLPTAVQQASRADTVGWLTAGGVCIYLGVLWQEGRRHEQRVLELLRLRFELAALAEERAQAFRLAEQSSAAKSRFLATVSHELRTPLNGVLGMVQLLMQDQPSGQQMARLKVVQQSSHHLLTLIDDLLDISRIEHGRLGLRPVVASPADLAREVADLLAPVAAGKGLHFELQLSANLPAAIEVDPARLRQILLNLAGNAVKFTTTGEVRLCVGVQTGGLQFSIIDTGPGLAPGQVERMFDAFVQGDAAGRSRAGGTGLGLAIARHLARAMGGDVTCSSLPGAGARFDVDLPLKAVPTPAPVAAPGPDDTALPLPAATVLVVEDNPVNALVTRGMLDALGLPSEHVEQGRQALARMAQGGLGLVLMDCQMPELDGWEASRLWRQREAAQPAARRLPIVALTANAVQGDRERCLAAGMDDYLPKPFTQAALRAMLARHLSPATDNPPPCESSEAIGPLPPARPTPAAP